jgi:hypothetical protein
MPAPTPKANKTQILLMRTGESRQGVVGLYQPGPSGDLGLGSSVKFMGISRKPIASYLISLCCPVSFRSSPEALQNI